MSRSGCKFINLHPGAFFKISPSSDDIFCSNFEDHPEWIWNAQIRGLFVPIQIWGTPRPYPYCDPRARKNLKFSEKIMDLELETNEFHLDPDPKMFFLQVLFGINEIVFIGWPFALLSTTVEGNNSELFQIFHFPCARFFDCIRGEGTMDFGDQKMKIPDFWGRNEMGSRVFEMRIIFFRIIFFPRFPGLHCTPMSGLDLGCPKHPTASTSPQTLLEVVFHGLWSNSGVLVLRAFDGLRWAKLLKMGSDLIGRLEGYVALFKKRQGRLLPYHFFSAKKSETQMDRSTPEGF